MRYKSVRLLLAAEINFFVMLGVCYLLDPHVPTDKYGISYYGNYLRTLIPYALAFVVSGTLILWATSAVRAASTELERARLGLRLLGVLMICLVFVPSLFNAFVGKIHVVIGGGIFLDQMLLTVWFVHWHKRSFINFGLLTVMVLSGVVTGLSVPDVVDIMFVMHVIYQLAAGMLMVQALAYWLEHSTAVATSEYERKIINS